MGVYTIRSAAQAVSFANGVKSYAIAMCLRFVRDVFSPGKNYFIPDADVGWQRATQKEYSPNPPAGAPVYWQSGVHGHIAVSAGNGNCISTDWPRKGSVGLVSITTLTRAWGMTYRGWSRDFAGDPIRGLEKSPVPAHVQAAVPVLQRGSTGPWGTLLQKELLRVFPAYAGPIKSNGGPNGIFGPATEAVVREFEKRDGKTRPDGIVDGATLSRLRAYGIRM